MSEQGHIVEAHGKVLLLFLLVLVLGELVIVLADNPLVLVAVDELLGVLLDPHIVHQQV